MAVRHGYGKIAGTDALVFAYDTGDTVNSYKGEPTENITPSYNLVWSTLSGTRTANAIEDSDGVLEGMKLTGTANTQVRSEFTAALPSSETQYTFSVEGKKGSTPYIGLLTYLNPYPSPWVVYNVDTGELNGGGTVARGVEPVRNGWYRIWMTVTIRPDQVNNIFKVVQTNSATNAAAGTTGGFVYYAKAQLEVKDHLTPFTTGTRSSTESLFNLATNLSLNATAMSFDQNSEPYFDGTDDGLGLGGQTASDLGITHELTFEYIAYFESSSFSSSGGGIGFPGYNPHWGYSGRFNSATSGTQVRPSLRYQNSSGGWVDSENLNSVFDFDTYAHVVTVKGDGYIAHYIDGELSGTISAADSGYDNTVNPFTLGYTGWNRLSGKLPVAKCYNRALTAGEIKNNYSHYKNRFGI